MSKEKAAPAYAPLVLDPAVHAHHAPSLEPSMREWKARDRVPPVLLITGKNGVGKRTVTHWLSGWMQCHVNGWLPQSETTDTGEVDFFGATTTPRPENSAQKLEPCGACPACLKSAHGTQVDRVEILPEADSNALKIDQFRDLKSRLGFGAHESAFRVVLIPRAHRMTTQAANSLLKLLEEPPTGWVFMLTAPDTSLLLPTLVSRCQTLRLRPLPPTVIESVLLNRGVASERARLLSQISEGSLGRALSSLQESAVERRSQVFEFLGQPAPLLTPLVEWAASDGLDPLLDQLESLTHDLIRASTFESAQAPQFANSDGQLSLQRHFDKKIRAQGLPRARNFWVSRSEDVQRARGVSHTPVNRKILVQDLLLGWME